MPRAAATQFCSIASLVPSAIQFCATGCPVLCHSQPASTYVKYSPGLALRWPPLTPRHLASLPLTSPQPRGRLAGSLAGWLAAWLAGWLAGGLAGWAGWAGRAGWLGRPGLGWVC